MKLMKPPKLELFCFLFAMPLVAVVLNLVFFEGRIWTDASIWLMSTPVIMLAGFIAWYLHVIYDDWIERKYCGLGQSRQRIAWKLAGTVFVLPLAVLGIYLLYGHFHFLGYQPRITHLFKGILVGISVNLIFEALYEADYIFTKYKESEAEKETIEQLSVAQEFDTLKSQVNPHFLFNCFNTLSSLISVDKEKADVFLNELSKVYRYLLRNNEQGLSTVENEVRFIKSYHKLLQTRHGDAVQLNVQIDKRYEPYLLPSLTLQLLTENVVKHNVLSRNKPLVIDIFSAAGNKLVINNNLQKRSLKAPSNNVGLHNIKAKYDLLKQPGFQVMQDDKNFTVVLPLIWANNTQKDSPYNEIRKTY